VFLSLVEPAVAISSPSNDASSKEEIKDDSKPKDESAGVTTATLPMHVIEKRWSMHIFFSFHYT